MAHLVLRGDTPAGETAREALRAALLAHAAGRLPRFKLPGEIRFAEALPRTATGKLRRFLLREAAGAAEAIVEPPPAGQV